MAEKVDRLSLALAWMYGFRRGAEQAGKHANDVYGAADLNVMVDELNEIIDRIPRARTGEGTDG